MGKDDPKRKRAVRWPAVRRSGDDCLSIEDLARRWGTPDGKPLHPMRVVKQCRRLNLTLAPKWQETLFSLAEVEYAERERARHLSTEELAIRWATPDGNPLHPSRVRARCRRLNLTLIADWPEKLYHRAEVEYAERERARLLSLEELAIRWGTPDGKPLPPAGVWARCQRQNLTRVRGWKERLFFRSEVEHAERQRAGCLSIEDLAFRWAKPDGKPLHPSSVWARCRKLKLQSLRTGREVLFRISEVEAAERSIAILLL